LTPLRPLCGALAVVLGALAGCGGSTSPVPPVDQGARQLVEDGARSAIVFMADGEETYGAAAGLGARPDQRFRAGSITKTFTATIVLKLVDEGKLRLADPVARYLPGLVPAARHITIRQLLGHRSGLVNFTDYAGWLEAAERSSTVGPRDVVRFATSQAPAFPAGASWSYSNTNYIALGLVIEKITGHSYAQELSKRILEPLELRRTELAATRRLPDLDDQGTNPRLPWRPGASSPTRGISLASIRRSCRARWSRLGRSPR
jgi:D-alanyl-D-alanine carboxypeptidase